ncbi:MAG TPA: hypothetical protein VK106_06280 [Balneolaceae bacterium]|nr:hypothetical protein [Balneolaceae bacterium]
MKKTTKHQLELAEQLEISISKKSFRIAAAQIYEELIDVFEYDFELEPSTAKQKKFAKKLGINVDNDSKSIANVRISVEVNRQNWQRIEKLGLRPGVEVRYKKENNAILSQKSYIISSIGDNARLWFKGGQGRGAFPHQIELENT